MLGRFPLVSTWRWLVPAAVAMALVGLLAFPGLVPRIVCGAAAALVALLWLDGRRRRPVLVVTDDGYQVEVGRRRKLEVSFADVLRVRAVPALQAMYLDCGDPARNLLVPPRRGYGFRFLEQEKLYVLLATRLADKLEVVAALETAPVPPSPEPTPPKA
jgi:hypothetical protein